MAQSDISKELTYEELTSQDLLSSMHFSPLIRIDEVSHGLDLWIILVPEKVNNDK